MSSYHIARLYSRLLRSPIYRRRPLSTHEEWLSVIFRRMGLTNN